MIREGYIPFLDYRVYYRAVGEPGPKPPLLLLHGGPGSTHNYFEVLDSLAEEDGRQLIAYDQLGCGNSYVEGRPELWTMETWLRELETVRGALGLGEVFLLGQSWGGMLLLEYLLSRAPRGVKGAVLSSTLPSSRLWAEEQHRLLLDLPDRLQAAVRLAEETGDYTAPDYREAEETYMRLHAAGEYGPGDPECLTRPCRAGRESYLTAWGPNEFTPTGTLRDFDVLDRLGELRLPVLIISGGRDLCTPYIAKTMHDRIPGSRWELLPGCRHMCFAEDTPAYIHLLREWMNGAAG